MSLILLGMIFLLCESAAAGFFIIPAGKSESNIITVKTSGGDFSNPVDAMNSISNSSEENPFLILMGAGTFTLAANSQLIMKPYVHILGSGSDQTIIAGSRSSSTLNDNAGGSLILGAPGTSIKGLSVNNTTDNNDTVSGVIFFQDSEASMEDIIIHQSGSTYKLHGLIAVNSTVTLSNITITLDSGTNYSYGAYFQNNSVVKAEGMTIQVSSTGGTTARGIYSDASSFSCHTLNITTPGNGTTAKYGIFINNSQEDISAASIDVSGGSNENYGIYSNQVSNNLITDSNISVYNSNGQAFRQSSNSSSIINNCSLYGSSYSSYNESNTYPVDSLDIINTEMDGSAYHTNCIRCVDPDDNPLDSQCRSAAM